MGTNEDELSLVEIIAFLVRYWMIILALAIAAAVTGYLYFESKDTEYEATATLVIAPSGTPGESGRASLNVQAYQKLIESAAIKQEATATLVKEGSLPKESQSIKVATKVLPAARAEDSAILEATAYGRTPTEAMKIANVWVKTFIDHVQKTVTESSTLAGTVLQAQLKTAKEGLSTEENERSKLIIKLTKEYQDAQAALDASVLERQNGAAETLAAYKSETKAKVDALQLELNLSVRENEILAAQKSQTRLQTELTESAPRLSSKKLELEAMRKHLPQVPPTLTLRKSIGDDALWNAAAGKQGAVDWTALQKQSLYTEVVNPQYEILIGQIIETEILVGSLAPRMEQLQKELDLVSAKIQSLQRDFARDTARLAALQTERETGLFKLTQSTQLAIRTVERQREEDLKNLRENHDDQKLRAERSISPKLAHALNLERDWNKVQQAKVRDELTDLRIGANAVEPTGPVSKKATLYAAAAAIAGALLGLLIAIVLHVRRSELVPKK